MEAEKFKYCKQLISPAYWFFKPALVTEMKSLLTADADGQLTIDNRDYAFNNGFSKILSITIMVSLRYGSSLLDTATSTSFCNMVAAYTFFQALLDFRLAHNNQKKLSDVIGFRCC